MVREQDQLEEMEKLGAKPILANLETDIAFATEGIDAVVFAAGSGPNTGPDKTITGYNLVGNNAGSDNACIVATACIVPTYCNNLTSPVVSRYKIIFPIICATWLSFLEIS